MRRKRPYGCLTVPGIVTVFLVILVVIGYGVVEGGKLFSPGALNAQPGALILGVSSHAELSSRCSACHAFFWQRGRMADRCIACHTDISEQQMDTSSLHGSLFQKYPQRTCHDCHTDHHGADAALTNLSKVDITHDTFGYSLAAHQTQVDGSPFVCNSCHGNDYSSFDQNVCISCHQEIKSDFMQRHLEAYSGDCLGCHDGIDSYGKNFNHETTTFPLAGKHAQVECAGCHTGARSIEDLMATPPDCHSCHAGDDIHQGQLGADCAACHNPAGWIPASFDHSKSNFPLTGAHVSLECTQCHLNNVFAGLDTTCYSCHAKDDAHQGQFGIDCGACHSTAAWMPATFDHSRTAFSLTGKHADLECKECHTEGSFAGLSTECVSCHADPAFHAGLFAGMSCDQCHNTSAWSPASFNLPHPAVCGEEDCINHEDASCLDCHTVNLSTATCLTCHDSNNPIEEEDD